METSLKKKSVVEELRKMILAAEGFSAPNGSDELPGDMGPMEKAFPMGTFPLGAIHEFISNSAEEAAASTGFIACLIGRLMQRKGPCLWVSIGKRLFPPSLLGFGIEPHRVIFINLHGEKDALWVLEEALKCPSLAAVVGEIRELDLTASRRLQLAVEQSRVTGFLHRYRPRRLNNLACVSRWNIRPLGSLQDGRLPGIGHPLWEVQLGKIRNGRPGTWHLCWKAGNFRHIAPDAPVKKKVYTHTGT